MFKFLASITLLLLISSLLGGCKPWVKPYERDRLADPIMSFEGDPASTRYLNHVFEARESGRGAEGGAGGGCGCN